MVLTANHNQFTHIQEVLNGEDGVTRVLSSAQGVGLGATSEEHFIWEKKGQEERNQRHFRSITYLGI